MFMWLDLLWLIALSTSLLVIYGLCKKIDRLYRQKGQCAFMVKQICDVLGPSSHMKSTSVIENQIYNDPNAILAWVKSIDKHRKSLENDLHAHKQLEKSYENEIVQRLFDLERRKPHFDREIDTRLTFARCQILKLVDDFGFDVEEIDRRVDELLEARNEDNV